AAFLRGTGLDHPVDQAEQGICLVDLRGRGGAAAEDEKQVQQGTAEGVTRPAAAPPGDEHLLPCPGPGSNPHVPSLPSSPKTDRSPSLRHAHSAHEKTARRPALATRPGFPDPRPRPRSPRCPPAG